VNRSPTGQVKFAESTRFLAFELLVASNDRPWWPAFAIEQEATASSIEERSIFGLQRQNQIQKEEKANLNAIVRESECLFGALQYGPDHVIELSSQDPAPQNTLVSPTTRNAKLRQRFLLHPKS
jgi:hypothetical protein